MSVAYYVMHCPSFEARVETAKTLDRQLGGDVENNGAYFMVDDPPSGAWSTARRCWEHGLESDEEFIVLLNDDALVPSGFKQAAKAALESARERSPDSPVCFYPAHPRAPDAAANGCAFYSTPDGLVGVGCGMHRDNVRAFLEWHDAHFEGEHTDDGRVNLWAMATGRRILTTVPALVGHQLPGESTVGNAHHGYREPAIPVPADVWSYGLAYFWNAPIARFGRQYRGNHWRLITNVKASSWHDLKSVETAYALERAR